MSESAKTFANFEQFWPHYLRQHTRYGNRLLHLVGNVSGLSITMAALVTGRWWWLIVAGVVGYAFAWIGHVVIERNRPATLGHPFWAAARQQSDVVVGGDAKTARRAAAERSVRFCPWVSTSGERLPA